MLQLRKGCREEIRNIESFNDALIHFEDLLKLLPDFDFFKMIQAIEKGTSIGFEGAFLGFLYVAGANNAHVKRQLFPQEDIEVIIKKAVIFLMTMRFQEERGRITGEEIAGMVAATRFDFTFLVHSEKPIVETCGMGGDIGFGETDFNHLYASLDKSIQAGFIQEVSQMTEEKYYDFLMEEIIVPDRVIKQSYKKSANKKSVNISTLSSFILASMGYMTMKHGSGKNTSSVGSTDAVIKFGIPILFQNSSEPNEKLDTDGFLYTDAIVCKTIHDLSGNVLETETVNHLIGPLTAPLSRQTKINKVLGVNHNVSFSVLGQAYETLHEKGVYNVGDVIIVGGLSSLPETISDLSHKEIRLDEFSPKGSMLGVVIEGKYKGEFLISEKNFGVSIDMDKILLGGSEDSEDIINFANERVISNKAPEDIIQLVCCNAALGILVASGRMRSKDFIIDGKINPQYLKCAYNEARKQVSALHVNKFMESIRTKTKQVVLGEEVII
ncbi:MAG: hypothetical protein PHH70_01105 [Candidatus Gracilibacteria bacterium]|nr:hypothetical protein [Candidatus Gracilibacteria bacterium]